MRLSTAGAALVISVAVRLDVTDTGILSTTGVALILSAVKFDVTDTYIWSIVGLDEIVSAGIIVSASYIVTMSTRTAPVVISVAAKL